MFLLHVQMLVYEFMPNGTLRDWLSSTISIYSLIQPANTTRVFVGLG